MHIQNYCQTIETSNGDSVLANIHEILPVSVNFLAICASLNITALHAAGSPQNVENLQMMQQDKFVQYLFVCIEKWFLFLGNLDILHAFYNHQEELQ